MKKTLVLALLIFAFTILTGCLNTSIDSINTENLGGFCGRSTKARCQTDVDCISGGCSGQLCQKIEENIGTTCEWIECYDDSKYDVSCGCVNGQCQWYK